MRASSNLTNRKIPLTHWYSQIKIVIVCVIKLPFRTEIMPDNSPLTSPETPLQALLSMGGPVMYVLIALTVVGLLAFFYLVLTGALFSPRSGGQVRRDVEAWKASDGKTIPDAPSGFLARCNPMHALTRRAMAGMRQQEPADTLRENLAQGAQKALQPFEAPLKIIEV